MPNLGTAHSGIRQFPDCRAGLMGDTLESSLRQALGRSDGSFMPFVERPMAAMMLAAAVLIGLWPLFVKRKPAA
jgi:TctA family transporter